MPASYEWSPSALQVLLLANNSLRRFSHSRVTSLHLVLGLLKLELGGTSYVLRKAGLFAPSVVRLLASKPDSAEAVKLYRDIPLGESAWMAVARADVEARSLKHTYLMPVHLFLGILMEEKGGAADLLASLNVDLDQMGQDALEFDGYRPPN